ncbi:Uncharacterised protein g398 [Pycnogonum litorale]
MLHWPSICLLISLTAVNCSVFVSLEHKVIDGRNHCVDRNDEPHLPKDVWYNQQNCEKMTCFANKDGSVEISGMGCPQLPHIDGQKCNVIRNRASLYPDCCPKWDC